ncbi:MAG: MarR family transcriptional regulator [Bacillota bacterium]|nr:MarR family transcriptional regulator [Bacillota bacterium]
MITAEFIGILKHVRDAYEIQCKELCKELSMPQTALDILLFVSNEKTLHTAHEIHEVIQIKPNLISANVEKLVQAGYLERRCVPGDRRSVNLICTEKAKEICERGKRIQINYLKELWTDISEDEFEVFISCLKRINNRALAIQKRR